MARGPVLHRRKQRSRVLRPNWNAVQWPRVFGIDMTSRASRPKWWGKERTLALNAPWDLLLLLQLLELDCDDCLIVAVYVGVALWYVRCDYAIYTLWLCDMCIVIMCIFRLVKSQRSRSCASNRRTTTTRRKWRTCCTEIFWRRIQHVLRVRSVPIGWSLIAGKEWLPNSWLTFDARRTSNAKKHRSIIAPHYDALLFWSHYDSRSALLHVSLQPPKWPTLCRNDPHCVGWGVKLYSLTHSLTKDICHFVSAEVA